MRLLTFITLALALVPLGRAAAEPSAQEALREASAVIQSLPQSDGRRGQVLAQIAQRQAERQDLTGARQTATAIRHPLDRGTAFTHLGRVDHSADSFRSAAAALKSFAASNARDRQLRHEALIRLARESAAIGENAIAGQVVGLVAPDAKLARAATWLALAAGAVQAGDLKAGDDAFHQALKLTPSFSKDEKKLAAGALADYAGALAARGAVEDARFAAAAFRENEDDWLASARIAGAQVRRDDLTGARQTAEREKRGLYRTLILVEIAEAQIEAGKSAAARRTLREAQDRAEGLRNTQERPARSLTRALIAVILARAGDMRAALALAAEITRGEERDQAFRDLAGRQADRDDVSGALATIRRIGNVIYREVALRKVVAAQVRAGQLEAARETNRNRLFAREQSIAWIFAGALAERGDHAAAMVWVRRARTTFGKGRALIALADGLRKRERIRDNR